MPQPVIPVVRREKRTEKFLSVGELIKKLSSFDRTCKVFLTDPGSLLIRTENGRHSTVLDF
jgi:hypothetical protein